MLSYMLLFVLGLGFVIPMSEGFVYQGAYDTSNGFCEGKGFRVAVGSVGYNDRQCTKIICSDGYIDVTGCGTISGPPNCRLHRPKGHYPNCC
ncbi:hypothetical protein X975_25209, partial [Stegodyphus mimosarum]